MGSHLKTTPSKGFDCYLNDAKGDRNSPRFFMRFFSDWERGLIEPRYSLIAIIQKLLGYKVEYELENVAELIAANCQQAALSYCKLESEIGLMATLSL